jgi:hypothetical protein
VYGLPGVHFEQDGKGYDGKGNPVKKEPDVVVEPTPAPEPEPVVEATEEKTGLEDLTRVQIMAALEELGVEYNKRGKRDDLLALLEMATSAD